MEIGDDTNTNSTYGSPVREMNLMDAVNLTTFPSSSATTTSILPKHASQNPDNKRAKNATHNNKSSVNATTDASRPPSSPDVTCSSTTPSLPSHSYVSYDGRRYTVFEVSLPSYYYSH